MLGYIILFSLLGGLFSLIGGMLLLLRNKPWPHQTMMGMISFAAGVLLAVAFADLLPEALEAAEKNGLETHALLGWTLWAIIGFFLFERSFIWFHHHHGPHSDQPSPLIPMVWIGDTLHNSIDGIVIAASFVISIPLGITTAIAVAAHEIPQEIADFSLYLSKGVRRTTVITLNVVSSLFTLVAALLTYRFLGLITPLLPQLLAFTAGMFTYIACSDLIPELHHGHHNHRNAVLLQAIFFLVGAGLLLTLSRLFHG